MSSPAQYELQLRNWGARKNINANEWRHTLQVVDQYNEGGIKCAVYRNGELVSPLILRKKRNLHCKGQEYARLRRNRGESRRFCSSRLSLTLMYEVSAAVLPECIQIKTSESQNGVAGMLDVDDDEDRDEDGDEDPLSSGPYNLAMTISETTPVATNSYVGAVGGFGMGESYIGTQIPAPNPFLEQPNQTMGAMPALANENQELAPSIINSISEILPDAPPLNMDFYIPTNDYSTSVMASPLRGNPAPRDTSPDWWNLNMQSPSFGNFPEARGKRILS